MTKWSPTSSTPEIYRLALEASSSGCIIVALSEGRVALVNRRTEDLLGIPRAQLLGKPVHELLPRWPEFMLELADTEATPHWSAASVTCHDGKELLVDLTLTSVDAADGAFVAAWLTDITEVQRAQQQLEALWEASPTGLLLVDATGSISKVNSEIEHMFGYERSELIGKPVERLLPDGQRGAHATSRKAFQGAPTARAMGAGRELHGQRKDGSELPVEIGLRPVTEPDGFQVLGSVVDITARVALEARLRQAEKMEAVGVMAGGVAHEFNNLLMVILGYSEMMQDTIGDMPELQSDLQEVVSAAERGQKLVQRILAFARYDKHVEEPLSLAQVVEDLVPVIKTALMGSIEIRTHVDHTTPSVLGDASELQQVLMNLASNAAHAMAEVSGVIDISLVPYHTDSPFLARHPELPAGTYARLSVADTGHGMAPDVVSRIFDPFFTTKPRGQGTGLGMTVIHRIVERHGGTIEVRSRPGSGTAFDLYFPAAAARDSDSRGRRTEPEGATARILYVEDEEPILALIRRRLEQLGIDVTPCLSSIDALALYRSQPTAFDLVITDNSMPHMTGMTLSQEILTIRGDQKILMVSGFADGLDADQLRAKGIRWLLRKPHSWPALANAVKTALEEP